MTAQAPTQSWTARWSRSKLPGYLLVLLMLGLWELSARYWTDSPNWPPFSDVFAAMLQGLQGGELGLVGLSSLGRLAYGYVVGAASGIVLGLLMGRSRVLRALLEPMVELLRPIPIPAIVPPLILILGIDDAMKIFVVGFSSFFPVLINTIQGAVSVDGTLTATARTFRIGNWRTLTGIVLPSALPYIFAGLRISLALALIVTVVAEMIAGSQGMGYYLVSMQYAMRPADMYAGVVLLAVAGYALNELFLLLERKSISWYHVQGDNR